MSLPFNSKAFIILFTDNSLFPITAISRLALALSVHSLSCTCPVLVPHSYSSCLLFIHLQDWAAPSIHPLHGYVDNGYASPIFLPTTGFGRNIPNTQRCNQFLLWRSCNLHEPRHCGNTMSVGQKTIVYLETYRTEVEEFNIVGTL